MKINLKTVTTVLGTLTLMVSLGACSSRSDGDEFSDHMSTLEQRYNRSLGVYAYAVDHNKTLEYNAQERFPFASTMKAIAAGLLLKESSTQELGETIHYSQDDLVDHSPVLEQNLEQGMTLEDIAQAAVRMSDNGAMNIMIEHLGGMDEYSNKVHELAGPDISVDRLEPELNTATPGDTQDTATPKALGTALTHLLEGDVLTPDQRATLTEWMGGNATGDTLIRAGTPKDSTVIDKSGAASYGTRNDIGMVTTKGGEKIILVIFSGRADVEDAPRKDKAVEDTARLIIDEMSSTGADS